MITYLPDPNLPLWPNKQLLLPPFWESPEAPPLSVPARMTVAHAPSSPARLWTAFSIDLYFEISAAWSVSSVQLRLDGKESLFCCCLPTLISFQSVISISINC